MVFDMDGLMLDTEAMIKPCFQQAAADLQCDLDDEFYATLIGKGAGMKTFMVPDGGHAPSPRAHAAAFAVFASLHDVTDQMARWLDGPL